jgi:hypothetical protein
VTITDLDLKAQLKLYIDAGFVQREEFSQLEGWNHILAQLSMANHYAVRLREQKLKLDAKADHAELGDRFDLNGFFVAFVTTYGKCFVASEGRAVQLDPNHVFKQNSSFRPTHEKIMEYRHNYTAHNQGTILVRATMLVKEEEEYLTVSPLITAILPVNEFEWFEAACSFVTAYARLRVLSLVEKVAARYGKKARISGREPALGSGNRAEVVRRG